jgi:hypothetical protein
MSALGGKSFATSDILLFPNPLSHVVGVSKFGLLLLKVHDAHDLHYPAIVSIPRL